MSTGYPIRLAPLPARRYAWRMSQALSEQGFQRGRSGNAGGLATNGARYRAIYAELEADIASDGAGALKPSEAVLLQQVALSFSRSERASRDVANATKSANAGARILRELQRCGASEPA